MLLPYFLKYVCQLINQAKEKEVSEKCIRIIKILIARLKNLFAVTRLLRVGSVGWNFFYFG